MKEFLNQIDQWGREGKKIALARVIQTWGSSPRPVGSCMLISSEMEMAGSVSGGCVEGAVLKEAKNVFETNEGKKFVYGVTDDDAWAVGLSCGGSIQVFLQPLDLGSKFFKALAENLKNNEGCTLITKIADGKTVNALNGDSKEVPESIKVAAKKSFQHRASQRVTEGVDEFFVHVFPPRSKVIIIGAAHITSDLIVLAKQFDFEVIVIDPRALFARKTTFAVQPDQIFENYPSEVLTQMKIDPFTYAVILSHDPKIDDDALKVLLGSEVAYIGALGSKKNHEKRKGRLLSAGFTEPEIEKINAPVGIDIHAQGAKEIALSIMGAIIKAKNYYL